MDPFEEIQELLGRLGELDESERARLNELLSEHMGDLSDDQLVELEGALVEAYDAEREADTPSVEALREVRDHVNAVREEHAGREEQRAQREQELAELDADVHGDDAEAQDGDGEGDEPTVEADDDEDDEGEQPAEQPEAVDTDDEVEEPEAQRQAASTRRPPIAQVSARRPDSARPRQRRRRMQLVAGGDLPGISAGTVIDDPERLGDSIARKIEGMQRTRAQSGRHIFASLRYGDDVYPDERTLSKEDAAGNGRKVDAMVASAVRNAQDMDALVAAGGLCAPVEVDYSQYGIGDDRRPIRDAFVRFGAERGGIRFITPPALSDVNVDTDGTYAADDDTAVALWTESTDSEPGSNVKPVQTITCGTETEEVVDAVTRRLQVGNFSRRTFAENFARWWELAGIAHARTAETRLWDRAVADSTAVSAGQVLGAYRDVLENLIQAAAQYRSRHRMPAEATLEVVLPDWAPDVAAADLLRQQPGDGTLSGNRQRFIDALRDANLNPVFTPDTDQEFGTQDAGGLNGWSLTLEALLYAPGSHLFLDGGELDFGMEIRDTTLLDTNDVQAFMETFEGHAFIGVESLHVTMTICPDGSSSTPIEIDPCTSGS